MLWPETPLGRGYARGARSTGGGSGGFVLSRDQSFCYCLLPAAGIETVPRTLPIARGYLDALQMLKRLDGNASSLHG
ncbi:MAG: hypothetical protein MK107_13675 [Oceanicola sp.]|nr:hypothetical protein [Oceanicola sp.]